MMFVTDEQDAAATEGPSASDDAAAAAPAAARGRGLPGLLLRALTTALLVILVAIGAAAIVVPALTGSTVLTVLTSSMEPHLPPGTMVVVRPTDVADIEPGMVITYQLESGEPLLVTHRVVQTFVTADGEPRFITQGDANPQPDAEPVREVQIRGIVWYAIPYLGWVATALGGELRPILLAVAVTGLLGYALWMFGSAAFSRSRRKSPEGKSSGAPEDATPE